MRRQKLLPLLALPIAFALGCGSDNPATLIQGEEGSLGSSGTIKTWARRDAAGSIAELGVTIDAATIDHAAAQAALFLRFPEQARAETFVDHLGIDFNPSGHGPPGVYDLPHFDVHFYGITSAERERIACADQPMPAAARIPAPFFIPGTGPEPDGTCVPGMGVHALDGTSPELDQNAPKRFDQTFILGYDRGALAFLEPMITQEMLAGRAGFARDVPVPQELGRQALWPQRLTVSFSEESSGYTITVSDFAAIPR